MPKSKFKYIYGPVYSWRLGMSLGIDPISTQEKKCSFDCCYCQLGKTLAPTINREEFVATKDLMEEVSQVSGEGIDYYTFSGRGEPTLALNIGAMIKEIKAKGKVAVITNSSLMDRKDVQQDLIISDVVVAKLDSHDQKSMDLIDAPYDTIKFDSIIAGLKEFRSIYKGKLALQVMFVKKNADFAGKIAEIAREIGPDEVQINTPLRPSGVKPLSEKNLEEICLKFSGLNVISVYNSEKKEYFPLDEEETKKRHGLYEY